MERQGEIYSPAMTLSRSSEEAVERDLWECTYAGVCHSVYRYGTHANGGSYCREITQEVAARLGRLSRALRRQPAEPVRSFLDAFGVQFFEGRPADERPAYQPFEMRAPQATGPSKRMPRRKSRAKRLNPEELRAQPQFKLPIAGGKVVGASRRSAGEATPSPVEPAAVETNERSGVELLSMKDCRPFEEQAAAWERFDQKLRGMGVTGTSEPGQAAPRGDEGSAPRKSA
jgi:hypothetical protein